ncbi:Acetyltransferase [Fulvia fulva]|uniref:Acetyltransferase n=1 Tax=Passalora fulva TaxID=5499 RepID=A0A9Q8LC46_PASFU|nr:Acetyltransferase [Fulvia fulva]KAK4629586.1 Acetyltransferase [Fulvia fulva]KAK4630587.1 Acetyltransferase [Fulvia fulva]UJO14722.1 Acetyltransferase [Fulvia fulva]WPV12872.1 Acetyltransferase [Fulvia fulva]WPV27768.1 Acetyltransferase [Fulvia fulva]
MASMTQSFTIDPVTTKEDLTATISLFKSYTQWLNLDLSFQEFDSEMSNMPGKYTPPTGALFLARMANGEPVGCVGLRALSSARTCEMKRLYVDPKGRGLGLGKALAERVIDEAKRLGYDAMMLDTLGHMTAALALYRELGFEEVQAYYETPLEGTVFLRLDLIA